MTDESSTDRAERIAANLAGANWAALAAEREERLARFQGTFNSRQPTEPPPLIPAVKRTAPELLQRAASLMDERGRQYDQPAGERSMGKCVSAFNTITERDLTEAEGWLLLQILKDVRQWQRPGYHADSAEDCIAYAALKAEALQQV